MKRRSRRGLFLVLEGLDGAGTTTQSQRIAAWMREQGRRVHVTAEPSRGPIGALVRQVLTGRVGGAPGGEDGFDPAALALLFAADRLDHIAAEVEPRLREGWDVLSDRFTLSSLAYQSLTCGDAEWVEQINGRALAPDATIFLDVDSRTSLRRRYAASATREIFEVPIFQRRVARAYQDGIARLRSSGQRVEIVDGAQPVEAVTADLQRTLARLLPRGSAPRKRARYSR